MLLFSLVSFANATDSLDERVRSVLVEEIGQRIDGLSSSGQAAIVKVRSTGLKIENRCEQPYGFDVSFSSREDFQGLIKAKLSMSDASGVCGNFQFYPKVEIWMNMPMAKESAMGGEPVEIAYQVGRYDQINGTLLSNTQSDLAARVNIAKGQPITLDKIRKRPVNRDGDQVELRVKAGSLSIKSNGKLMRDAYLGEQVKVLSFATSSVVQGTLTRKGIVEIGAGK